MGTAQVYARDIFRTGFFAVASDSEDMTQIDHLTVVLTNVTGRRHFSKLRLSQLSTGVISFR